jgi:hypothetical protein
MPSRTAGIKHDGQLLGCCLEGQYIVASSNITNHLTVHPGAETQLGSNDCCHSSTATEVVVLESGVGHSTRLFGRHELVQLDLVTQ